MLNDALRGCLQHTTVSTMQRWPSGYHSWELMEVLLYLLLAHAHARAHACLQTKKVRTLHVKDVFEFDYVGEDVSESMWRPCVDRS